MSQLMQANKQWSSRPADQRFESLNALDSFCQDQMMKSREAGKVLDMAA